MLYNNSAPEKGQILDVYNINLGPQLYVPIFKLCSK